MTPINEHIVRIQNATSLKEFYGHLCAIIHHQIKLDQAVKNDYELICCLFFAFLGRVIENVAFFVDLNLTQKR